MSLDIRDYAASDHERCKELVNQAWSFDENIPKPSLAELAKDAYVGFAR